MSEISCGESLYFSTKDQYKVINRNQLSRVELPVLRAASTNIDCGISLIQEISDVDDDFDGTFEGRSKKERIREIFGNFRQKSKRKYMNLKKSISRIGSKLKLMTKDSRESLLGITSRYSSRGRVRFSTSLNRLKSLSVSRVKKTTRRRSRTQRKVVRASSRALSRARSNISYFSKRCVSGVSLLRSKTIYNYYKLRNIIGSRFQRRSSKFVLCFRKGSNEAIRKTMNCDIPEKELVYFGNNLVYDSMEYISENVVEEIEGIPQGIEGCELEFGDVTVISNYVRVVQDEGSDHPEDKEQCEEQRHNVSNCEDQRTQFQELDMIRNYCSGTSTESGRELDEETPTTVDSFPRLGSMDSTTCTSIQNDTNFNTPFPPTPSLGMIMERLEAVFRDLGNLELNHESISGEKKFLIGTEDQEILSSMRDLVDATISSGKSEPEKQSRFRSELIFTLLKQTLQYYENVKNSNLKSGSFYPSQQNSVDGEKIRNLIFSAVQKLKAGGNLHAIQV
ncbi:hypothetical protein HWI79_2507 [Cryptosporidium felis]|nr:hypothetical protein HWI79_2507 [Cryptosporidium felis]